MHGYLLPLDTGVNSGRTAVSADISAWIPYSQENDPSVLNSRQVWGAKLTYVLLFIPCKDRWWFWVKNMDGLTHLLLLKLNVNMG